MARAGASAAAIQAEPLIITKLNLTTRYQNGHIKLTTRLDDKGKPVARICRVGAIERLRDRGSITYEQYLAAERYALLHEAAQGADQGDGEVIGCRVDGSPPTDGGATIYTLDALQELRELEELLGKNLTYIATQIILYNKTIKELAKNSKYDPKRILGWLDSALTRMAEYWGFIEDDKKSA
ncbi:hypothetical protein [Entomobacter blattae]|uniref:Uncharacterized protein n=1 Tax=Entomobacter blattae TaxID=2762277 RepID=A0A7H1NUF8_9PROT|nr:hypothetical protein [Entomobacter blattae]QNT79418.1 hypothetical protein JGUZn3_22170 [Entomobacter blattae]